MFANTFKKNKKKQRLLKITSKSFTKSIMFTMLKTIIC